jgi:hypothetical protein
MEQKFHRFGLWLFYCEVLWFVRNNRNIPLIFFHWGGSILSLCWLLSVPFLSSDTYWRDIQLVVFITFFWIQDYLHILLILQPFFHILIWNARLSYIFSVSGANVAKHCANFVHTELLSDAGYPNDLANALVRVFSRLVNWIMYYISCNITSLCFQ